MVKIIEEPQLEVKRKLPRIIDIFLYPFSASGLIHLAIFGFGPLLLGLVHSLIFSRAGHLGAIISLGLYILLVGYLFYYLAYCIFDSSKGGRRAPDIVLQGAPDRGDLVSQLFLMLGCVAVCFWPAALYYIFTQRIDLIFWLLLACAIFLFPMALLRGVLFDSFHALNPILIISSIFKALLKYCSLVLFFCILGGLVAKIISDISDLPKPQGLSQLINYIFVFLNYFFSAAFIYKAIAFVYLAMVAAHLLGSFYWWHKDKLTWGL